MLRIARFESKQKRSSMADFNDCGYFDDFLGLMLTVGSNRREELRKKISFNPIKRTEADITLTLIEFCEPVLLNGIK
jgi:hypothetical protein